MCSPVGSLHGGQLSGQRWSEEGQPPPRPRSRHPGNTASGFTSCDWTRQVIFHNSPSPGRLENLTRRLGSCRIQFSTRNDLMQNILKIWLIHLVQFGLFGSTSPPPPPRKVQQKISAFSCHRSARFTTPATLHRWFWPRFSPSINPSTPPPPQRSSVCSLSLPGKGDLLELRDQDRRCKLQINAIERTRHREPSRRTGLAPPHPPPPPPARPSSLYHVCSHTTVPVCWGAN